MRANEKDALAARIVGDKIVLLRGQRVMLSHDLAALYGVETKVLMQAVKRNIERFPNDFMFQLTAEETVVLRSQCVTLDDSASASGQRPPKPDGQGED